MKRLFLGIIVALLGTVGFADGVYQLPNWNFEGTWYTTTWKHNWSTYSETCPTGWNSFSTASGGYNSYRHLSPFVSKVTGYNNTGNAIQIYSKKAEVLGIGANANGDITTGTINMGSSDPGDASNYNYTDRSTSGHYLLFAGRPDAVSCYAKFTSGGSPNGRGNFILHGDVDYRDPEISTQADNKIGIASIIIPTCTDWTYYEASFSYSKATPTTQYMLASFTTNPTPGGSIGDYLIFDDVTLIYYSQLATLTYDGVGVTNFSEDGNTEATAYTVNSTYDASKLAYTLKGTAQAATVDKSNYNATTGLLKITVSGNDISVNSTNVHTYYVQFIPQLTLDEASTSYTTTNNTYSITLKRSLKSDSWNTLCLPFSLTSAEITTMFGSGAKVAKFTGMDGTSRMLFTTTDRTITAGEPCLITGTTTASPYTIGVKAITAATAGSVTQGSTTLQGTYSAGTVPQGAYFINSNKFYYADNANVTMKGFRAYVTTTSGGGAKAFDVSVDGQTTAVEGITTNTELTGAVYNLNGQQVRRGGSNAALPKGVYIQDGKKIVIR